MFHNLFQIFKVGIKSWLTCLFVFLDHSGHFTYMLYKHDNNPVIFLELQFSNVHKILSESGSKFP